MKRPINKHRHLREINEWSTPEEELTMLEEIRFIEVQQDAIVEDINNQIADLKKYIRWKKIQTILK